MSAPDGRQRVALLFVAALAATARAEGDDEDVDPEVAEKRLNIIVATCIACLGATFVISHVLEHRGVTWLPEAAIGVLIGALVASGLFVANSPLMPHLKFSSEFFFEFLLPPIIFEAGYNLDRRTFFRNFSGTLLFAFAGTSISAVVVGVAVYYAGEWGLCHRFEQAGLASALFGSLISATDPVTVLAVFQKMGVNEDLFAFVFGESVMNDAVAIVLVKTLLSFLDAPPSLAGIEGAVQLFLTIFAGSLVVGILFGLASALVFKHLGLIHADSIVMETVLLVSFAWSSYYAAEGLDLSGIVAILFCGVVMAKYTRLSMSSEARAFTSSCFTAVATFSETFIFVYLGFALLAFPIYHHTVWSLVGIAALACLVGRALNIYPNVLVLNALRRRRGGGSLPTVPATHAGILWFSGLRGGVAFALASVIYARGYFREEDGLAILQTTLLIAVCTVFLMGGSIEAICARFKVRKADAEPGADAWAQVKGEGKEGFFARLDRNVLVPTFTIAGDPEQDAAETAKAVPGDTELAARGAGGAASPTNGRSKDAAGRTAKGGPAWWAKRKGGDGPARGKKGGAPMV